MAGTSLTFTVNDTEARELLARLAHDAAGSIAPRLGEYLLESSQRRFDTQRAPDGSPWAPLKKRYAERKKYHRDKILTLRGYLRRNIRYQSAGPNAAQVGSNTPYAAIHQLGGAIKRKAREATVRLRTTAKGDLMRQAGHSNLAVFAGRRQQRAVERKALVPEHIIDMPARPFFGVSGEDEVLIAARVADWLAGR